MDKLKRVVWLLALLGCASGSFAQYKLTIEQMFDLAEQNSKSLKIFDIAHDEAVQAVKVAKNSRLPSVDLSLSVGYLGDGWMMDRDFSNGFKAPMPHFGNNFAIEASQIIYSGGAISNEIIIAGLKERISGLSKENNRQDIRLLLVGNYLEIYKLNNQEIVFKENIKQTNRLLADIRAKRAEGIVLDNDITRYELQLKSLELSLVQIRNSRMIINNQLVSILGLPHDTYIQIDDCLQDTPVEEFSEEQWLQTAILGSPLLKQAAIGVEISKKNEKLVRAERLPSLALFAGDKLDGPVIIEVPPINKNFNYWYVGVGMKFNLASTYKTKRKSTLARLESKRVMEQKALLEEQLQTDVNAAYIRFAESFTIYQTQLKSLQLAMQNYEVVNNRYLNELVTITDMLDASNSKLNAELQVSNSRINILFNYYKLKRIAGEI